MDFIAEEKKYGLSLMEATPYMEKGMTCKHSEWWYRVEGDNLVCYRDEDCEEMHYNQNHNLAHHYKQF